ncbi:NTP transferase domain-containing protein [Candidatus Bathyarchaeota archaeon]|nr:NTP transferase domain-containing protein [Candidatus Bathyarchaeota archaeon]
MDLVGLVMAGGRGTRMGSEVEKPLIIIGGKSMLVRVVEALKGSSKIGEVIIATSRYTPRTEEEAVRMGLRVIRTEGSGYVADARQAIEMLVPRIALVVSADLPLISSRLIDYVIQHYFTCGKPALKVVTYSQGGRKDGSEDEERLKPAGLNIIDSNYIWMKHIEEADLLVDSLEVALNVNTPGDVERLRGLLSKQYITGNPQSKTGSIYID